MAMGRFRQRSGLTEVKSLRISLVGMWRIDYREKRWDRKTSYGTVAIICIRDGSVWVVQWMGLK